MTKCKRGTASVGVAAEQGFEKEVPSRPFNWNACTGPAWDASAEDIKSFNPRGLILSGGPESVTDSKPPLAPEFIYKAGVPVLGICYGMQAMAQQLGGRVTGNFESMSRRTAPPECSSARQRVAASIAWFHEEISQDPEKRYELGPEANDGRVVISKIQAK